MIQATLPHPFDRLSKTGEVTPVARDIAVETPIAIEVNGVGYAVLMTSPCDLEDLATGFVLSERLAATVADVLDLDIHAHSAGQIVRLTMTAAAAARVADRVRHRTSDGSCGLCGIENLEQAIRPLPLLRNPFRGTPAIVFTALRALAVHQPLNRATGAVHAAAWCDARGNVRLAREDVGRHNAFDKLIGAMARAGAGWDGGFALLTSRCSYELVEKAAIAGCPLLATISAPTSLALSRAAAARLPLLTLARSDSVLVAHD